MLSTMILVWLFCSVLNFSIVASMLASWTLPCCCICAMMIFVWLSALFFCISASSSAALNSRSRASFIRAISSCAWILACSTAGSGAAGPAEPPCLSACSFCIAAASLPFFSSGSIASGLNQNASGLEKPASAVERRSASVSLSTLVTGFSGPSAIRISFCCVMMPCIIIAWSRAVPRPSGMSTSTPKPMSHSAGSISSHLPPSCAMRLSGYFMVR